MSGRPTQIQRRALGGAAAVDRDTNFQHRVGTVSALLEQLERERQEETGIQPQPGQDGHGAQRG